MAGRPKGTGRKQKITTIFEEAFKFELSEKAIYIGGLYTDLKHKTCKIISRSKPKNKIFYVVEFENGIQKTMPQSVLKPIYEQIKLENIVTAEEDKNENN